MVEIAISLAFFAGSMYLWYLSRHSKRWARQFSESVAATIEKEYAVLEDAPWLGCTGLGEEAEREVGHYLRREYSQSVHDDDSIKLRDLEYLGLFLDDVYPAHYWKYAYRGEVGYVSLMSCPDGPSWGCGIPAPVKPAK